MLDAREIDIEIARLEYGESSYPAYAKLADLYTIRNQMRRAEGAENGDYNGSYSSAPAPPSTPAASVPDSGDSDFLRAVAGKSLVDVLEILDDLMDTLQAANPRAYSSVMRKIHSIE